MKRFYLASAAIITAIPAAFATADVEPVVVVATANGPVRISASQYNEKQHDIFKGDDKHNSDGTLRATTEVQQPAPQPSKSQRGKSAPPPSEAPADVNEPKVHRQFGVIVNKVAGKDRFFVVDSATGKPVTDDPVISADGYAANKEAWDTITKVMTENAAAPS